MFKCKDCGVVFNYSDILDKVYHGSFIGTVKKHCPSCKSESVSLYEGKYCACCGAPIKEEESFCSPDCEYTAKLLREREERRKRLVRNFGVSVAVREVESYNRSHNKKLSYGEYFAMKREGLIQ